MARSRKQKYTLEIVFGGIVLFLLLSIVIPLVIDGFGEKKDSPSRSAVKTGVDVPIEAYDYVLGDQDAPVTVVEFSDYQCPSCKQSAEMTLAELKATFIKDGTVRYVIKDFPLTQHANATSAALAARAAGEQGKYWEMHDLLFKNQGDWAELPEDEVNEVFVKYAEELGLDVHQFKQDLTSNHLKRHVAAGRALGEQLGVRYTPTLIVNGTMYEQAVLPEDLPQIIEGAKNTAGE